MAKKLIRFDWAIGIIAMSLKLPKEKILEIIKTKPSGNPGWTTRFPKPPKV